MVQRCHRDTHKQVKDYRDRGIKVEFTSREEFIRWALEKWPDETFKKKEFDRIDNNGNYSKENLRLVTSSENKLNSRRAGRSTLALMIKQRHPELAYTPTTILNLIYLGHTEEQIVERAAKNSNRIGKKPLGEPSSPRFRSMTS
jgi:hypothetical protein